MQTFSTDNLDYRCQPILVHSWFFHQIFVSVRRDYTWSVYTHGMRFVQTLIDDENWQNRSECLFGAYFGPNHQIKMLQASEIFWVFVTADFESLCKHEGGGSANIG